MGLCPSRNQNTTKAVFEKANVPAQETTTTKKYVAPKSLRASAEAYVPPRPDFTPTESWEHFLENKQQRIGKNNRQGGFNRRSDGTYTSGYQQLLGKSKRAPWAKEAPQEPVEKKKKLTSLKKQILAQRVGDEESPLIAQFEKQLQKAQLLGAPKEAAAKQTQDDVAAGQGRLVPFGLSERHYASDAEDAKASQKHVSSLRPLLREYVGTQPTPELEEAVTEALFRLRALKMQEANMGIATRRYTVGFREVTRMLGHGNGKALIVAPDVERTRGALEAKIASLVEQCENNGIPVIYALSRRQLGQALQKNVAISVLGIEESKGAEAHMERMLRLNEAARCRK